MRQSFRAECGETMGARFQDDSSAAPPARVRRPRQAGSGRRQSSRSRAISARSSSISISCMTARSSTPAFCSRTSLRRCADSTFIDSIRCAARSLRCGHLLVVQRLHGGHPALVQVLPRRGPFADGSGDGGRRVGLDDSQRRPRDRLMGALRRQELLRAGRRADLQKRRRHAAEQERRGDRCRRQEDGQIAPGQVRAGGREERDRQRGARAPASRARRTGR